VKLVSPLMYHFVSTQVKSTNTSESDLFDLHLHLWRRDGVCMLKINIFTGKEVCSIKKLHYQTNPVKYFIYLSKYHPRGLCNHLMVVIL
jgi:hypothetical protein